MPSSSNGERVRLSIDVDPALRRKLKIASASRDLSIRDYVLHILQQAITREHRQEAQDDLLASLHPSARSFTRDWESEADQVYDQLS